MFLVGSEAACVCLVRDDQRATGLQVKNES